MLCEKIGRFRRRPTQVCPQPLAHVGDALLGIRLGRGSWPRRQLKHGCRLTLAQACQQHGAPVRKFERIVMCGQLVLVDLSKDCRLVVDCLRLPPEWASRQAGNLPGEGQFCSRHHAHRQAKIIRGGKAACSGAEVSGHELVADFAGRERTLWRLKSHICRTPSLEAPSAPLDISVFAVLPHHTKSKVNTRRPSAIRALGF